MIKDWVARSMQIACIANKGLIMGQTPEEILKKLHKRERLLNLIIPNWNIQDILHLGTIKEDHGIPEDDLEAQELHQKRVERDLIHQGIDFARHTKDNWDFIDDMHCLDWIVFKGVDKIDWQYMGSKGKKGGIMSRLEKGMSVFIL